MTSGFTLQSRKQAAGQDWGTLVPLSIIRSTVWESFALKHRADEAGREQGRKLCEQSAQRTAEAFHRFFLALE